jgi:peptidoglycan/LPS O-acetylase OafA/YrhL
LKYVKGFDTIRALAVFFVIVDNYHWGPVFKEHTWPAIIKEAFIPDGLFGVTLFFVLSGFLITSILLHEKIKAGDNDRFTVIQNFFARRVLRIFPIYYLTVLLCCLFNYEFVRTYIAYFLTYTSNVLEYKTNAPNPLLHTWSLAVEEQFYLIWPWLILFINKKYLKYVFASIICIGLFSKYTELYILHHSAYMVSSCFDSFGIGALYAYMRLDPIKCKKFEYAFIVLFPVALFIALKANPISGLPIFVIYSKFIESVIGLAMIMFVIHNKSAWIKKHILENRVFNYVGKISYGIYLYHYTLGHSYDSFIERFAQAHPTLPAVFTSFWFSYGVKLILLITVCALSYKFIEQPILRLKKKFEYVK